MSDVPFVLRILADTSQFDAEVDRMGKVVDEMTQRWSHARQDMINGLSAMNQAINYTFQSLRLVAKSTGQVITPIQSALMGVISGTTSLMLSTATLLSAQSFGLLAGVGVALAAYALGWNIAETIKLSGLIEKIQEDLRRAQNLPEPRPVRVGALF